MVIALFNYGSLLHDILHFLFQSEILGIQFRKKNTTGKSKSRMRGFSVMDAVRVIASRAVLERFRFGRRGAKSNPL